MNRRELLTTGGLSLTGLITGPYGSKANNNSTPLGSKRPIRMHIGCQWPHFKDPLLLRQRFGVKHVCMYHYRISNPPKNWDLDQILRFKEKVESYDQQLDMLVLPLRSMSSKITAFNNIMLAKDPERDQDIDAVCKMIELTAKAGIPSIRYNLNLIGMPRTESTPGRGGTQLTSFFRSEVHNEKELTEAGIVDEDEMWERIAYFLNRVIPVATQNKVRMACHPHDPPIDGLYRGVARVLGTPEGLQKLIDISPSPYHGLNFCVGTVGQMLQDPGKEICGIVRHFGQQKKIFNIHLRNIRGKREAYSETHHDEGDMDLFQVVRELADLDYPYMVMPDHVPSHPDDEDWDTPFAFAYGYIHGLLQAVQYS